VKWLKICLRGRRSLDPEAASMPPASDSVSIET
jgi:hypothetical protein